MSQSESKGRPVVVTTAHNGIFFGYAVDTSGDRIKLSKARNAYYYKATKGFMELAESGPKEGSRIGARADIELRNVTSVSECSPAAVDAWESREWAP
jgi:hypothetical protein